VVRDLGNELASAPLSLFNSQAVMAAAAAAAAATETRNASRSVTYCASRRHQYADSAAVPVGAQFPDGDLTNVRQRSSESIKLGNGTDDARCWDRIRKLPDDYVVHSSALMTNATAEAWRIAAITYVQSRVMR
ncbi:hypothetical protein E4U53_003355, partial [Claviceps sorghi]